MLGKTYTGDLIRKYRKEKGLTQKQLGERCGINEANIRKYELGNQNPKIETLQRIADALEVPFTKLGIWNQYTTEDIKNNLEKFPAGTKVPLVPGKGRADKAEVTAALRQGAKDKLDKLNHLGVSRAYDYIGYLADKPENTEPDAAPKGTEPGE